jgi:hypothetical protein
LLTTKNLDQLDKIENPRYEHYPRPIVSCYTVREMDKVYRAIGCSWRVVMLARPDYSNAKTDEIMANMHIFRINNGIIDHDDAGHDRELYGKT